MPLGSCRVGPRGETRSPMMPSEWAMPGGRAYGLQWPGSPSSEAMRPAHCGQELTTPGGRWGEKGISCPGSPGGSEPKAWGLPVTVTGTEHPTHTPQCLGFGA